MTLFKGMIAAVSIGALAAASPALADDCAFDDAAFQNKVMNGPIRDKAFKPVVEDLRTLRQTLKILQKYNREDACEEVAEAMEDISNNPPQELARKPVTDAGGKVSVAKIMNSEIRSSDNEYIGHVEDVILDANGAPGYVIVEHGGFLGIGEEQAAIPFKSLQVTPDREAMFVPLTTDQFEKAPRFKRESVGWMKDKTWRRSVDGYYAKNASQ